MAHSDTEELYDSTEANVNQLIVLSDENLLYDTEAYEKTIHSGHFMVSHVHEEVVVEQESILLENIVSNITENLMDADIFETKIESNRLEPIDQSLETLFKCMNLFGGGKLTSPKWKNFKGVKFKLKEKIRLNNIIWREWHMQFVYHLRPVICQFSSPMVLADFINKNRIIDKKFCHKQLLSIADDYKKWRNFFNEKFSNLDLDRFTKNAPYCEILQRTSENNSKQLRRLGGFITKPLYHAISVAPPKVPQMVLLNELLEEEEMLYDEFSDSIYSATGMGENMSYAISDLDAHLSQFPLFDEASYFPQKTNLTHLNYKLQRSLPINETIEEETKESLQFVNIYDQNNDICNNQSFNHDIKSHFVDKNHALYNSDAKTTVTNNILIKINDYVTDNEKTDNVVLKCNYLEKEYLKEETSSNDAVVSFQNNKIVNYEKSSQLNENQAQFLIHLPKGNKLAFAASSIKTDVPSTRRNTADLEQNKLSSQNKLKLKKKHSLESLDVEQQYSDSEIKFKIPKSQITNRMKSKSCTFPAILPRPTQQQSSLVNPAPLPPPPTYPSSTPFNLQYFQPVKSIEENANKILINSFSNANSNSLNAVFQPINPMQDSLNRPAKFYSETEKSIPTSFEQCLMKVISTSMKDLDGKISSYDISNSSSASNSDGLLMDTLSSSNSNMTCRSRHTSNDSNSSYCDDSISSRSTLSEQKRSFHLVSEQKRRHNLKYGIDTLNELIGLVSNVRTSKAVSLQKATEFCQKLKAERSQTQEEIERIKNEIEYLREYINKCQSMLPERGAQLSRPREASLDNYYYTYINQRLQNNWKYFILRPICENLFISFKKIPHPLNKEQAIQNLIQWVHQDCSLFHLRPMLTNSLCNLCLKTSILDNPSIISNEVLKQLSIVR